MGGSILYGGGKSPPSQAGRLWLGPCADSTLVALWFTLRFRERVTLEWKEQWVPRGLAWRTEFGFVSHIRKALEISQNSLPGWCGAREGM